MATSSYFKIMFFLSLAGVLFSGYLSAVKFFTSTCAFNESCPYFLSYPACWFGFGMFLVLFISAIFSLVKPTSRYITKIIFTVVSLLGIIFAGQFVLPEIQGIASSDYSLGLPTCVYGLVFYIIIFIFSVSYLVNKKENY